MGGGGGGVGGVGDPQGPKPYAPNRAFKPYAQRPTRQYAAPPGGKKPFADEGGQGLGPPRVEKNHLVRV